jgi:subtilisin family serine protease
LLALVTVTTLLATGAGFAQPATEDADPYIVVLEDNVDSPSQVAQGIEQRQNLEVGFVYSNALEGFSATIPDSRVAAVRANPLVDYVERDGIMHAAEQVLPWGIQRIGADLSPTAAINGEEDPAISVNAYIIDTGVDETHADLNVVNHVNCNGTRCKNASGRNIDCNGHGTHVAGTVAAKDDTNDVVGVAPGAPLIGVKVLDCGGFGSNSRIIEGIDWVTRNAVKPAIANLSLDGPRSRALNNAVRNSARSGVFYSVAAGNADRSACKHSPASAGAGENNGIVTTAAINKSGAEAQWSNHGSCVDLWAPGVDILSTRSGGGTTTLSGTSMAAPHVGGTGALYLANNTGATPVTVESVLKTDSVFTGKLSENSRKIRLVYAGTY